jgi:acetone carboxylase gamma subunit
MSFCPKCDYDIDNFLYQLELEERNFFEYEKFECPECGAKLKVKLEASFYVEEDEGKPR